MVVLHMLLAFIAIAVLYCLTLTYYGKNPTLREFLVSSLVMTLIVFCTRDLLEIPPTVNVMILLVILIFSLYFINKLELLMSAVVSLLGIITVTLSSLLITCPLLTTLGIIIPERPGNMNWIYLNLAEQVLPLAVMWLLKKKKISLSNLLK